MGVRTDIGGDPKNPDANRVEISLHRQGYMARCHGRPRRDRRVYNLTMDPFEKYDMTFNGAMSTRLLTTSPGKYAGSGQRLGLGASSTKRSSNSTSRS